MISRSVLHSFHSSLMYYSVFSNLSCSLSPLKQLVSYNITDMYGLHLSMFPVNHCFLSCICVSGSEAHLHVGEVIPVPSQTYIYDVKVKKVYLPKLSGSL